MQTAARGVKGREVDATITGAGLLRSRTAPLDRATGVGVCGTGRRLGLVAVVDSKDASLVAALTGAATATTAATTATATGLGKGRRGNQCSKNKNQSRTTHG